MLYLGIDFLASFNIMINYLAVEPDTLIAAENSKFLSEHKQKFNIH